MIPVTYGYKRRLSPSSINTYRQCPFRYFLSYIIKLPTKGSIHTIKGSAVHNTLEEFFIKYNPDLKGHALKLLKKYWKIDRLNLSKEEATKHYNDAEHMIIMFIEQLRLKIEGLLLSDKANNEPHAFYLLRPKFQEHKIFLERLNLTGRIDKVDKDFDNNYTIVDYKTSSKYGITLPVDIRRQLALYALMWNETQENKADYVSIHYLRYGETYFIEITPSLLKYAENEVIEIHRLTESDNMSDYNKHESKLCRYCDFYNICKSKNIVEELKKYENNIPNNAKDIFNKNVEVTI